MDRNTTNKIKGLAILSVLLSHGADMGCFNPISREWFAYFCIGGMSCFFFLSGHGLYLSYKSKGFFNYWENKFKKFFSLI